MNNDIPKTLEFVASVVELFDDATMRADYMISSGEAAEIIRALSDYLAPQQHAQYTSLSPVIQWIENGCDPQSAAKELSLYQKQMGQEEAPLSVQQHAQAALSDEKIAHALWVVMREHEDRCDMELEDMGKEHHVWEMARAVSAILATRHPAPVASAPAVAVPEGWKLVQKVPTQEQLEYAAYNINRKRNKDVVTFDLMLECWENLLHSAAAAPQPAAAPVAADVAQSDRETQFEDWAKSHGGLSLMKHPDHENEEALYPATYFYYATEIAWRAFANAPDRQPPADAAPAKPNADCSGDQSCCPDNEGYGCACTPVESIAADVAQSDAVQIMQSLIEDAVANHKSPTGYVKLCMSYFAKHCFQPPADAAPAWHADATKRLRSIVYLLELQHSVPEGDLTGYEFAVLGFVRREIARLKSAQPSPAQSDSLSHDAKHGFAAWASVHYRNADEYTAHDHKIGESAWNEAYQQGRAAGIEEAAKVCMRATPNREKVRAIGEAAHYAACADAIRALTQPTAVQAGVKL